MMVGGRDGNEGEDAEGELYRLMRGYESEEEEDEVDSDEEIVNDQQGPVAAPVIPNTQTQSSSSENQGWGSTSSYAPSWGSSQNVSSSSAPSWESSHNASSSVQGWESTYTPDELRRLQSSWNNQREDKEAANSWEETGRRSLRQRRNQEMEGGRSPPPKLREENLFSEGDSRVRSRPAYELDESKNNWGWGDVSDDNSEKTMSSIFGEISEGVFDPTKMKKGVPVKDDG